MKSWTRRLCFLLALAVPAAAQRSMTVNELVTFIKSSIQLKHDDRQLAASVKKVKLSNKLDARTVETLQGMGAGPSTVAALRLLVTESSGLAAPPPPGPKRGAGGPPSPDA